MGKTLQLTDIYTYTLLFIYQVDEHKDCFLYSAMQLRHTADYLYAKYILYSKSIVWVSTILQYLPCDKTFSVAIRWYPGCFSQLELKHQSTLVSYERLMCLVILYGSYCLVTMVEILGL